jgi:hypothetical protein
MNETAVFLSKKGSPQYPAVDRQPVCGRRNHDISARSSRRLTRTRILPKRQQLHKPSLGENFARTGAHAWVTSTSGDEVPKPDVSVRTRSLTQQTRPEQLVLKRKPSQMYAGQIRIAHIHAHNAISRSLTCRGFVGSVAIQTRPSWHFVDKYNNCCSYVGKII